jgi:hypothetical protein
MTHALPFTKARLRRAIEAAREAGLRVIGIRSDGTLLVNDGDKISDDVAGPSPERNTEQLSRWGDVQA